MKEFITAHVEKIKPLDKQANLAWWDAAVTGDPKAYDRSSEMQLQIRRIYSDPKDFAFLKEIKESGQIQDPLLARQLTVLYNAYLANQIEPDLLKQIVELGTQIEKNFSTFRGTIDGKKVTDNEIMDILKNRDGLRQAGEGVAGEQAGRRGGGGGPGPAGQAAQRGRPQARLRQLPHDGPGHGRAGRQRAGQDLRRSVRADHEPFAKVKAELDQILAKKYGIAPEKLMPWHYHDPFFQEAPMVYDLDLDVYYKGQGRQEAGRAVLRGLGLPVEAILAHSDLYEKEGKNPHAFCNDIDREGDVRVLCNLKNDEYWMETILHELGHGVYVEYLDRGTPYVLRTPAHTFTTEAMAMFFGRLSRNPAWMQQMLGLSDAQRAEIEKVGGKYAQLKQLIFARWDMVMYTSRRSCTPIPIRT